MTTTTDRSGENMTMHTRSVSSKARYHTDGKATLTNVIGSLKTTDLSGAGSAGTFTLTDASDSRILVGLSATK